MSIYAHKTWFIIKANGVTNGEDYFEIKVRGTDAVKKLQDQFRGRFSNIVKSLRIMFDALVLMNP